MEIVSDTSSKQASSGWQIALKASEGDQYLGSAQVVDGVVRHFFLGIYDRFVEVCEGRSTPWEAGAGDKEECEKTAEIMTAANPSYTSQGEWNAGGGLARHVGGLIAPFVAPETLTDPKTVLSNFFALITLQVYRVFNSAGSASEEKVLADLDELVDEVVRILLGQPSDLFDH